MIRRTDIITIIEQSSLYILVLLGTTAFVTLRYEFVHICCLVISVETLPSQQVLFTLLWRKNKGEVVTSSDKLYKRVSPLTNLKCRLKHADGISIDNCYAPLAQSFKILRTCTFHKMATPTLNK